MIWLVTSYPTWQMKRVTSKPAIGSAMRQPNATPPSPTSAPNDETTSSHECFASGCEGHRLNAARDVTFISRHGKISDHSQNGGNHADAKMRGPSVRDQLLVALPAGEDRAAPDHERDSQAD